MAGNIAAEYALAVVTLLVALAIGLLTLAIGRVFGPARRPL